MERSLWRGVCPGADECARQYQKSAEVPIYGADIDSKTVDMAKFHSAARALRRTFVLKWRTHAVLRQSRAAQLFQTRLMRSGSDRRTRFTNYIKSWEKWTARLEKFKYYFITADEQFERWFGRVADKRRKLYNGNVKCCFYQYFRRQKWFGDADVQMVSV